jgi:hypothetical protein
MHYITQWAADGIRAAGIVTPLVIICQVRVKEGRGRGGGGESGTCRWYVYVLGLCSLLLPTFYQQKLTHTHTPPAPQVYFIVWSIIVAAGFGWFGIRLWKTLPTRHKAGLRRLFCTTLITTILLLLLCIMSILGLTVCTPDRPDEFFAFNVTSHVVLIFEVRNEEAKEREETTTSCYII